MFNLLPALRVLMKKQVIAIGKKTACAVELHPVEVTYNTPSTLLFCRYDNALRTLPDPLGRLHLKCSRRVFIQHHLIDSVVGRSLGRFGVFQLVVVHRVPRSVVVVGAVRKKAQNAQTTTHRSHQAHQHLQQIARMLRWFRKSRGVFHSTLSNYLSLLVLLFSTTFLQPL